jgi:hypothetical protein
MACSPLESGGGGGGGALEFGPHTAEDVPMRLQPAILLAYRKIKGRVQILDIAIAELSIEQRAALRLPNALMLRVSSLRLGRSFISQLGIEFRQQTRLLPCRRVVVASNRSFSRCVKSYSGTISRLPLNPQLRRWATTVTLGQVQSSEIPPRAVGYWLLSCSALVFTIVIVGGITRLTESGLSITEWKPITGVMFPTTAEKWQEEYTKYSQSPEFKMSVSHF